MVEPASLAGLSFFLPIFAFLLVFVVVYALLAKTKVLGENKFVHLLISFILAVFFIVEVELVDFVQFSSAWIAVFFISVLFILILVGFVHGNLEDVFKKAWVAWILVVLLIIFFIISSAYVFDWAVNWPVVGDWFYSDWFGFILLLVIAAVAAAVITKKVKK